MSECDQWSLIIGPARRTLVVATSGGGGMYDNDEQWKDSADVEDNTHTSIKELEKTE